MDKKVFFIVFWTAVLGPFEFAILGLPFLAVVLIRFVAIFTNIFWYKRWFERSFWDHAHPLHRIGRMVSMKVFVNISNFAILFMMSLWVALPLHFTLLGFAQKVMYVSTFAVLLTWPYELLLKRLGFEANSPTDVDYASDI